MMGTCYPNPQDETDFVFSYYTLDPNSLFDALLAKVVGNVGCNGTFGFVGVVAS